ncbi:hypothetical protein HanRHA438_Chr15g0712361 [Helianthus annuus]|nr:hypothetical protein HanRHA438_Chr15g0712361 [Helianthus annuus]
MSETHLEVKYTTVGLSQIGETMVCELVHHQHVANDGPTFRTRRERFFPPETGEKERG